MHGRFATRLEDGLRRMAGRLAHAQRPLDRGRLERQIGRLLAVNSRAAGRYDIRLIDAPNCPATLRLEWQCRPEWDEWARYSEGAYVLRTNITEWSPETLWHTYVQLSEAEAAFRIHKSESVSKNRR